MYSAILLRSVLWYLLFSSPGSSDPRDYAPRTLYPEPAVVCTSDFDTRGGIAVYILIVVLVVIGLGVLCEHDYKHALMVITEKTGLPDDVAGATIMAAGTSSPALFLSLIALLQPSATDDTGAGTIVGSAIFNVCVTIGLSAAFSPVETNLIRWGPIARDVAYNVIAFTWVMGSFADGFIQWYEAMLGVLLYISYVVFMIFNERVSSFAQKLFDRIFGRVAEMPEVAFVPNPMDTDVEEEGQATEMELIHDNTTDAEALRAPTVDLEAENTRDMEQSHDLAAAPPSPSTDMETEVMDAPMMPGEHEFYHWKNLGRVKLYRLRESFWTRPETKLGWISAICAAPFRFVFFYTIPNAENPTAPRASAWICFTICLTYLLGFTVGMVIACQKIGCLIGMDEAVIGATLLAWGSSLPDALTSIFVAKSGKGNMAVSNVLGANVFDVLFALGFPWLLLTLIDQSQVAISGAGAVIYTGILFFCLFTFIMCMVLAEMENGQVCGLGSVHLVYLVLYIYHSP